jgi:hypothetical protein
VTREVVGPTAEVCLAAKQVVCCGTTGLTEYLTPQGAATRSHDKLLHAIYPADPAGTAAHSCSMHARLLHARPDPRTT